MAPRDQCHQPAQVVAGPFCRKVFRPLTGPPWKSHNVLLLGASPANQCLQHAPKKLLVAIGSGADDIDELVSPGHGGSEAGRAGACGETPRRVAASTVLSGKSEK